MFPQIGFLSSYSLCISIGIIAAFFFNRIALVKRGFTKEIVRYFELFAFLSTAIGWLFAALFQAVYAYLSDPSKGFSFFHGFTFFGGLFGGLGSFLVITSLFCHRRHLDWWALLEVVPATITLAHGFGRIGCFMAGCCYGTETNSFLGVQFPGMSYKVWPTQLFESAFLFLLFGLFCWLLFKKKAKFNFPIYLFAYGVFRFLIEFIRGDNRGIFVPGLSPSQFWSIILILLSFVVFAYLLFFKPRHPLSLLPQQK